MQVLVITNQLIKEDKGNFYCIENLYDILERFSQIGTLHLCAVKYHGVSSNVLEADLVKLVDSCNIHYVTKTHLLTDCKSKKIIEECVKSVDLVIGYLPNINATTACKLAKKYNKKYMSYVVGCVWDALWNHGIFGKILAPYNFLCTKKCLKKSDYALYVTNDFLQKRYPCPGITCGCSDVRIPEPNAEVLNNRLNFLSSLTPEDDLHIVTIANNSVRYKGQHFVIKALAELKKKGINKFHYHLIGAGDKSWLEKLARKLGVESNVHFDGMIPHSVIFEQLDKMHVYIQPSLQEGLPRSVVEAMSRGLLCICSNTAAMPELVESEFIVERKSVTEIANVLLHLTIEKLRNQANRNFEESKKYCEKILYEKRNAFFKKVKQDFKKNV